MSPRRGEARHEVDADTDIGLMRQALRFASKARGLSRPNPAVGAVVVGKSGRVLARGYTHRPGQAHAEVDALEKLGCRAPDATMYVTLEPCCHEGRTGPCTAPIVASGIRRVVVGCLDTNPLVSGRGIARLRRAGVRVDVGCLEDECFRMNRGFFRWIRDDRPWVTLKAAATLDGFIAPSKKPPQTSPAPVWITGEEARRVAHELRAEHDAILVGAGTVIADDPRLTVRPPRGKARSPGPERVILDGRLRTPARAQMLADGAPPPLVYTASIDALPSAERPAFRRRARALEQAGARLLPLPPAHRARPYHLDLAAVLASLAGLGVQSLLVEGGAAVHGAFIAARLVDEVAFFFAPRLGGGGVPIARGGETWEASESSNHPPLRLGVPRVQSVGGDILVTSYVEPR